MSDKPEIDLFSNQCFIDDGFAEVPACCHVNLLQHDSFAMSLPVVSGEQGCGKLLCAIFRRGMQTRVTTKRPGDLTGSVVSM